MSLGGSMARFPTSSFEQDKKINYKLGARSVVADAMWTINAVAAWYEHGDYWFLIKDESAPWTARDIADHANHKGLFRIQAHFEVVDKLALLFALQNYPPAPPIIDPIYFGT
jgi:hypothetical protein